MVLTKFDDFPIHQTPDPIAHPASSDKDVYERYWFNGYSKAGDMYLGIGTALYPHLGIQDCGISIVYEGHQYAFHASARATPEPSELRVGPFNVDIVEPMRSLRVTLEPNETDFACDLLWEGRTGNVEEPRHHFGGGGIRKTMDTTRFAQLGHWSGWIEFGGKRLDLDRNETWGTKDRSWGIRPLIGGDTRGAPNPPRPGGGLFFLWAPLNFDDLCLHYQLFEDWKGRPLFNVGAKLPVYDSIDEIPGVEDEAAEHMRALEHQLTFKEGSRMAKEATIAMTSIDTGERHEVRLEPIFTYRMKGIGYMHPKWVHGQWHDELAMESESWALADVDETAFENQHVQHLVRAYYGDRVGIGVLEQIVMGPYKPYRMEGAFDAPSYD
jgi:hypothetical protein